jgi:hypothetical protein
LSNIVIIKTLNFLVLRECVIKKVHDYTRLLNHAYSVQGRADTSFAPVALNALDILQATLHDPQYGVVLIHDFIDDHYILFIRC